MHRVIVVAVAAASLAGCSSVSDVFKSTPPTLQVQLESNPPGAEARTSIGPSCTTPCSVSFPAPEAAFSVSYTLDKHQPADVSVNITKNSGTVTTDPNPVFAELQPAVPPKRAKKSHRPKKPKAAATAAPGAASPFPEPGGTTE